MRNAIFLGALVALAALSSTGCALDRDGPGGGPSATPTPEPTAMGTPFPEPTPYPDDEGLELVRRLPHDNWCEGLDFWNGELWEAFPHAIKVYDPMSGALKREYEPPSTYSESLAWRNGALWNVSYHDANVYVGTPSADGSAISWRIVGSTPDVAAWGITHDESSVIVTGNGREHLYFLDPSTAELRHSVTTPVDDLEDIEFDRGAFWASSYSEYHGQFFRIHPATGEILDVFALPDAEECTIVDGIAVEAGELYVTGKECPWIYVYSLP